MTTILCLIAQYLLCRKRVENWFFWIAADIIYVPLYTSRGLPLISVLYGIFLILYLLTGDEIPFVQDGLRDGEHIRRKMHQWFIETLDKQTCPWLLVTGTPDQRLQQALTAVRQ